MTLVVLFYINKHVTHEIQVHSIRVMMIIYCLAIAWVTLISRSTIDEPIVRLSIRSLLTIDYSPDGGILGLRIASIYEQTWLNILLFIPLGFLRPMAFAQTRRSWIVIGTGTLVSLLIEITQLITHRGWFDVDDIFLNTLGAVIGYGFYKLFFQTYELTSLFYSIPLVLYNDI